MFIIILYHFLGLMSRNKSYIMTKKDLKKYTVIQDCIDGIYTVLEKDSYNYYNSAALRTLKNKYNQTLNNNNAARKSVELIRTPIIMPAVKAKMLIEPNGWKTSDPDPNDKYQKLSNTEVIITTPTGADLKTILIYAGSGVLLLGFLATGVFIIKKKILK